MLSAQFVMDIVIGSTVVCVILDTMSLGIAAA